MTNTDEQGGRGGSIRERRNDLGLSRQQLAAQVGCSMSYLALIEGGFTPHASDVLSRIFESSTRKPRVSQPQMSPGARQGGLDALRAVLRRHHPGFDIVFDVPANTESPPDQGELSGKNGVTAPHGEAYS